MTEQGNLTPDGQTEKTIEELRPEDAVGITGSIRLEERIPDGNENKFVIPPDEKRKNFRTWVAGALAIGLWGLLGVVVLIHIVGVACAARSLASTIHSSETLTEDSVQLKTQVVEESVGLVDNSSKTLYAFLTPLATAITGYYFSTVEAANTQSQEDDENSD